MLSFDVPQIAAAMARERKAWLELLRVTSLSVGVYHLPAGSEDRQKPHTEDEVYYVIRGRAKFRAGNQEQTVGPGTLLFVEWLVEHRFFDMIEDLTILVLFAPPEHSLAKPERIDAGA